MPDTQQDLFAAIDLGSNSFHMVIAKAIGGELQMIDRIKESVRLASGLLPNGDLDKASKIRALDCLSALVKGFVNSIPKMFVRLVPTRCAQRKSLEHSERRRRRPSVSPSISLAVTRRLA